MILYQEASEDDDGVLDKLSLDSRFKALKVKHLLLGSLKDSFLRLFALENNQDCKVKECWCLNDNVWGGNLVGGLAPRGRAISDLNALLSVTRSFSLDDSPNYTWLWRADASGIFKVKSLTTCLQNSILSGCELGKHHVWNMLVPRKVNICVWRASLNRFPSPVNLISQGVPLSSSLYPFCDNEIKDIEHSLIKCSKFSQHLSDDEASNHEDASDTGVAPKQQQQVIPQTTAISNIKLPILKKEEYDIWAMEMEHYLEYIDNDVWKFEAFTISSSEGLEKGYDRFQQLLSQLMLGAEVTTEMQNPNFSRSLPQHWFQSAGL
ncbi:RNA-directed DNA polymerase, eukaryota, reverse transcriptase zinc-binding domain protein [Tanacetum coccineum]